uniref:Uncharacterized protein n=1 Tax=Lotharella globosa TaxID=91324 RepID=A0A6V3J0F5_9EUKA|mmetsp:Transcript_6855/g.13460  ORF Transcript_6855/g.13460 Transcript_6855/m.13460 type:complete len:234 (+) Transcript_6855:472-1173(+)|eukprot:CAMPEP_0167820900 /NCGR_PEP_ID=MMETSP0112_2-20121227/6414_1 /TAXON_ID=91324 /ORGANISM="Lotharella globosa, Strain CCCM811" /LENGTH=233 /DNA_ID=CAMNT_0007721641 /DNA_START=460 /DNA_END=1161 /DNA_ORIENTATION=+
MEQPSGGRLAKFHSLLQVALGAREHKELRTPPPQSYLVPEENVTSLRLSPAEAFGATKARGFFEEKREFSIPHRHHPQPKTSCELQKRAETMMARRKQKRKAERRAKRLRCPSERRPDRQKRRRVHDGEQPEKVKRKSTVIIKMLLSAPPRVSLISENVFAAMERDDRTRAGRLDGSEGYPWYRPAATTTKPARSRKGAYSSSVGRLPSPLALPLPLPRTHTRVPFQPTVHAA